MKKQLSMAIAKFSVLVGVAGVVVAAWLASDEHAGVCGFDEGACYFSANYHGARARFRDLSQRACTAIYTNKACSMEVLRVSESPDLTIDITVLPAAEGTDGPVLLHMSGTHGVEAYAGSAVQLALLSKWADNPQDAPANRGVKVAFVHAVNPYGFHCSRRFNEDNADLNRNVLSAAEFAELAHSDAARKKLYDDHSWMFNWNRAWTPVWDDALFAAKALYGIAVIGMVNVKRAIVAGQYHQPNGLYYGGSGPKMAKSHELLLPLLKRVAVPASAAIVIDVHSGLGPMGVDTLMPPLSAGPDGDTANVAAVEAIFSAAASGPDSVLGKDFLLGAAPANADGAAASSGYELTKGSTENYLTHLAGKGAWERALQVTQEFGTLPGPLVLRGMIIERADWLYGTPAPGSECNGTARGANAAKGAFYVQRASWQRKIVRRGRKLAEQAIEALATRPTVVPKVG